MNSTEAGESMKISDTYLKECRLCPRKCGADRLNGETGYCEAGLKPRAALAALHFWEEPCISGENGSGAVFFSQCNLSCLFCQNYKISQEGFGRDIPVKELAEIFLWLQEKGANNINLVSATSYIPQAADAIQLARQNGLALPIVYNSNAYESVEALSLLDGLVDIYLPDLKYADNRYAMSYSKAPDYFLHATGAILEMYRQTGKPVYNEDGIMQKGLIIRHLLLPGLKEDSKKVLLWIKEKLPIEIPVSLMTQYTPVYRALSCKELNRRITRREYEEMMDYFFEIGLENGYIQERSSADSKYTPEFDLSGIPDK
jgi:putative pyruvate formate lyase activating enzyme